MPRAAAEPSPRRLGLESAAPRRRLPIARARMLQAPRQHAGSISTSQSAGGPHPSLGPRASRPHSCLPLLRSQEAGGTPAVPGQGGAARPSYCLSPNTTTAPVFFPNLFTAPPPPPPTSSHTRPPPPPPPPLH